jgi:hypothetical protein
MARRSRNLYEIVEADDLAADEPVATPENPAPGDDRPHRRPPRVGAAIALICALILAGVLVTHLRHRPAGDASAQAVPAVAATLRGTVVARHQNRRRSSHARHRFRSRAGTRHIRRRHRRTERALGGARAPIPSSAITTAKVAPRPITASPRAARPRLSPAEVEFGIEH